MSMIQCLMKCHLERFSDGCLELTHPSCSMHFDIHTRTREEELHLHNLKSTWGAEMAKLSSWQIMEQCMLGIVTMTCTTRAGLHFRFSHNCKGNSPSLWWINKIDQCNDRHVAVEANIEDTLKVSNYTTKTTSLQLYKNLVQNWSIVCFQPTQLTLSNTRRTAAVVSVAHSCAPILYFSYYLGAQRSFHGWGWLLIVHSNPFCVWCILMRFVNGNIAQYPISL